MNFKRIAIISLTVNFVGMLFFAGKRIYFTAQSVPESVSNDNWNAARASILNQLPIDSTDIVFVGNSITEGFALQETFGTIHIKNRGISGNQSRHIMGRIREVAAGHPKKIFFDIGVNDLRVNVPIDSIIAHYSLIVDIVRSVSPQTEILVHSVFPVGPKYKEITDSITALNARLLIMSRAKALTFIDLYDQLLEGKYIKPVYTFDDLHLTGAGYAVWKKKVQPLL